MSFAPTLVAKRINFKTPKPARCEECPQGSDEIPTLRPTSTAPECLSDMCWHQMDDHFILCA